MPAPYGGELPIVGADHRITVEAPDGTNTTTPVNQWDIFKLAIAADTAADSSGYKAVPAVAADNPSTVYLIQALHRMTSEDQMGVVWLSGKMGSVRVCNYDGAAPTVGQSIEIAAGNVRKVTGKAHVMGQGLILKVDTTTATVEVLI